MPNPQKPKNKMKETAADSSESLEEIIEHRKTVAEAYRKILKSLESKLKNR